VHLAGRDSEVFGILRLNNRDRLTAVEDLFHGTINAAFVHGREVVRAALKHNSARIICHHNHPSGDVQPSEMDLLTTRQLKTALALVDVTLVDHLVVGDGVYSFAEHGLL
jgi:DNA repair protein RadC